MNNTDENKTLETLQEQELVTVVADEKVEVKVTELPKAWTDEEKAQYAIVRGYVQSVDEETAAAAVFVGVPDKVVNRAKRDAK